MSYRNMWRSAIALRADEQMRAAIQAGDILTFIAIFEDIYELSGQSKTERLISPWIPRIIQFMAAEAAGAGNIEIMKWLRNMPCQFAQRVCEPIIARTAGTADQIPIMRWVLEQDIWLRDRVIESGIKEGWSNEMLELFLQYGTDVNRKKFEGKVRIFIWRDLLDRDEAFVKLLLDHGLDLDTRDDWSSWTALDYVAARGTVGSFRLLLQRGADVSKGNPLHAAAGSRDGVGRQTMMAYLLDEVGLGVNAISTFKTRSAWLGFENGTPMHAAINAGNHANMKFLLERGADLRVKNEKGVDAWTLAESYETELVDVLEKAGQKRRVASRNT